jgi:pyruvoyl-dependent arginine decarboxylase (PvlArgDC)
VGKLTFLVVANVALCLAGCAPPDRNGYGIAAEHHEKFAQIAGEGVAADASAAQSYAAQGNQSAASHAEESASQFRRRYWVERFQADKDRWLSQWWPSLSRQ